MSKVRVRATLDMTVDVPDVIAKGPKFWSWADYPAVDRFVRDHVTSKLSEVAVMGSVPYYKKSESFNVGFHKLKEELDGTA